MSFLRRLASLVGAKGARSGTGATGMEDPDAIVFYVRCDHCGEVVRVRADKRWDLVQEFGEGVVGYTLHKEVLGTRCNRMMTARIDFDRRYAVTSREAHGGSFATKEEYEAASVGQTEE